MKQRLTRLLAALALVVLPATAGDCLNGTDCSNACPLAKHANTRLATGDEALKVFAANRDRVSLALLDLERLAEAIERAAVDVHVDA